MVYLRGWRLSYVKQPDGLSQRPISIILENRDKKEGLRFESGTITQLTPQDFSLIKPYSVRIDDVFCCLGIYRSLIFDPFLETYLTFLVTVTECQLISKLPTSEVYRITNVSFLCLNKTLSEDVSHHELKKLFSSGAFYFAKDLSTGLPYDLTRNTQSRFSLSKLNGALSEAYDNRFLWNRGLMLLFFQQRISPSKWIYPIICGSFGVSTLYAGLNRAQIGVVSRLSALRPGTRFNVRGVDDNGSVANFVETEIFFYVEKQVLSHVQIRGTVPLFWEQPGLQLGSHKIKICRLVETSLQAFNRHFAELLSRYSDVIILNLMGMKASEGNLSNLFKEHWSASSYQSKIDYIHFDYHATVNTRGIEGVRPLLTSLEYRLNNWGFFYFDGAEVKRIQTGVVRTNCVDCLDRTNAMQTLISIMLLRAHFLRSLNLLAGGKHTETHAQDIFQSLWIENGDNVSRIYAGTGALGGDRSKLKNVQRSATRTIKNNFFDSTKQEAMVALLNNSSLVGWQRLVVGQFLPPRLHFLPQSVLQNILDRNEEFTRREWLKVFVGTWNVNGGRNVRSLAHRDNDLCDWLAEKRGCYTGFRNPHADLKAFERPTDIFAVGFEEIIDLNAGNVVAGKQSSENQQHWGTTLQSFFDQNSETGEPYVLLCTTQLVGVCIFVFLRLGLCGYVRELASASVKTGLRGKAGNKGAVAVRFQIGATSLCFCCSHLTAGQSAVRERNAEVLDISHRLLLSPGKRGVLSHDYVFWFGDLNYRINLPNEETKNLISRGAWLDLLRSDQLSIQRDAKAVFEGFSEGPLAFAPTYKYDLFCDDYDTSEKARCPAWTDRVLWRRAKLTFKKTPNPTDNIDPGDQILYKNLLVYYRAEMKISDHRPVAAVFDIDIQIVEPTKRRQIVEEELLAAGPGDATVRITWSGEDRSVNSDNIYQSIVELASSAGTIVLTRFQGHHQLLITFSSPYEAVEAVRCLNSNKVSVERESHQIVLSVCLNSAPCLPVDEPRGHARNLDSVLKDTRVLDKTTREWLDEMRKLVDEADAEYLRTHGTPPEPEVFHPNASMAHLRQNQNISTDETRRERLVSILSNEDQALINLLDDEEEEMQTFKPLTMIRSKNPEEKYETLLQPAISPRVPPRPPPPTPASHLPDLSMLKNLLPPEQPLHAVHSCSDLLAQFDSTENGSTCQLALPTQQTLRSASGITRTASARNSPQHTHLSPPLPKRPPPRPQIQHFPPSSVSPPDLIDLSDHPTFPHKTTTTEFRPPERHEVRCPKVNSLPSPLGALRVPPPLPERPEVTPKS